MFWALIFIEEADHVSEKLNKQKPTPTTPFSEEKKNNLGF